MRTASNVIRPFTTALPERSKADACTWQSAPLKAARPARSGRWRCSFLIVGREPNPETHVRPRTGQRNKRFINLRRRRPRLCRQPPPRTRRGGRRSVGNPLASPLDERTITGPLGGSVTVIRFRAGSARFDLHVGATDPTVGTAPISSDAASVIGPDEIPDGRSILPEPAKPSLRSSRSSHTA
jgi:hypothetical protein